MRRVVVFGTGGFGREVMSHLIRFESSLDLAFVEDQPRVAELMGRPVLSSEALPTHTELVIAIGNGRAREAIAARTVARWPLLAPGGLIGEDVQIGEGCLFCPGTIVTASARIGRHFQCNINSYVAHDCVIGDFVTFAPNVACNGNVHIGDFAYLGTGAVLKQGTSEKPLRIGEGATVGMGAVVTKDVPPGAVVVGNPARIRA